MSSKLSISLLAALLLCAGVARADPMPAAAEDSAAESDNPDSLDYRNRIVASHSPSDEEIGAAEAGSTESLRYRDRMPVSARITQEEWQALESGNPDVR